MAARKSNVAGALEAVAEFALVGGVLYLGYMLVSNAAANNAGGGGGGSSGAGLTSEVNQLWQNFTNPDSGGPDFGLATNDTSGWT